MTNASPLSGGAVLLPTSANAAVASITPAEAGASDAMSLFLAMLTGMAPQPPLAESLPQSQAATDDAGDAAAPDPASLPADAAAQALIASLMPPPAVPAASPNAGADAGIAETATAAAVLVAAASGNDRSAGGKSRVAATPAALVSGSAVAALDTARGAALESALMEVAADAEVDIAATLPSQAGGTATAALLSAATVAAGSAAGSAPANPLASPLTLVSQLGSAFTQGAASDAPAQQTLQHPVGSARWAEELGSRITLMASQGQQSGSLRLTPEHLGPLEVQIDIKQDVASVWFGSQHADTRAALQDAMPRLRELFANSGLVLGDSGVSRDTPRQDARAAEARRFDTQRQDLASINNEMGSSSVTHAGLLDTYA